MPQPGKLITAGCRPLADVERDYIGSVLRAVGGNRAQAAAKLSIGEATLYRKIERYGEAKS